jgi:hypothetical protein
MQEPLSNDPRPQDGKLAAEPVAAEPADIEYLAAERLDIEQVDAIAVIESVRVLEPVRSGPPPIVQAAAVAATSFVAGAATAAVLNRRRTRQSLSLPSAARALPGRPAGGTQTFLVHVRQISRP